MIRLNLLAAATLFAILGATAGQSQEKKPIAMVPVKYDGLKQEVLKHRGKVLLVDFWGSFCVPCRKEMPHIIELHRKLADQGFTVINVSIDELEREANVASANAFLNKIHSPFTNLLLDEPSEMWAKKLGFNSVPCYYVFDRRGKWVRFHSSDNKGGEINFADVEKTITRMLAEK